MRDLEATAALLERAYRLALLLAHDDAAPHQAHDHLTHYTLSTELIAVLDDARARLMEVSNSVR
ncbi:MAG: hypothetical protein ABW190_01960 [Rhizobacter sp.]